MCSISNKVKRCVAQQIRIPAYQCKSNSDLRELSSSVEIIIEEYHSSAMTRPGSKALSRINSNLLYIGVEGVRRIGRIHLEEICLVRGSH